MSDMTELLLPDIAADVPPEGLPIGRAAEVTGVGIPALRYYEREGLLLDPAPRGARGHRYYQRRDLAWIAGLVMLRETGMSISEIRVMADLSRREGTEAERLEVLERHRERVIAEMERTRRHLRAIERKIAAYREVADVRRGTMRTTDLGDGLRVSAIGLGAMGMSAFYGPSDEAECVATLRHAVDRGVTFIDTAEAYGPFENEKLIARALGDRRDEVVLATKASAETDDDGTVHGRNGTPAYIRRAAERSLRHLGTDVIDLYYLHRVDPEVPIEESVGAMSELVREGKVRHIGLSEASAATIRRAHAVHPLAAVQSEFSLFARDVLRNGEKDVMDELGIGLVAFSPLGRGFLTGDIRTVDDLAPEDARRGLPRFRPEAIEDNLRLVERVRAVAEEKGATPAQVALAWVAGQGVVPIPGTRRRSRLDENVASLGVELTGDERARLAEALPEEEITGGRDAVSVPEGTDR